MVSKKIFLIFATVFLIFGSILGSVYFYISSTLTPEQVKNLVIESLQDTFPQGKIDVGEVGFKFGPRIDFSIEHIRVSSEGPLLELENAHLKIPVWSILKGGGILEFDVSHPKVTWVKQKDSSNWQQAMMGTETSDKKNMALLALPAFLQSSRLNIKMRDVNVSYQVSESEKGEVVVSKFLVKELGMESPAAFEIDTKLMVEGIDTGRLAANILLIGELDFKRLVEEEIFSSIIIMNVSNIQVDSQFKLNIPDFRTDIKVEAKRNKHVKGNVKTSFLNSLLSFHYNYQEHLNLEQIDSKIAVVDLITIFGNRFNVSSGSKSILNIEGSVLDNGSQQSLEIQLAPPMALQVKDEIGASFEMNASIKNDALDANSNLKLLQGEILSQTSATIPSLKLTEIHSIQHHSIAKTINIDSKTLDVLLKKNSKRDAITMLPPFDAELIFEESKILEASLDGKIQAQLDNKLSLNSKTTLKLGGGQLNASYKGLIAPKPQGKFDLLLAKIPANAVNYFLKEKQGKVSGILDFSAKGELKKKLNAQFDLKVTEGRIEAIDPGSWLEDIMSHLGPLTSQALDLSKKIKITPDFGILQAKGSVTSEVINFSSFTLKGKDEVYGLSGKGKLSLMQEMSSLLLEYRDQGDGLSALLKNEIGTEVLPLKLDGVGTSLKPDVIYSVNQLGKAYGKKNGKKALDKKVKKLIQGIINE